jgi:TolB-like protein/DNA-binding winged helix-turn-helix (wHTH) protein/Flp pilus assembly protein TadD
VASSARVENITFGEFEAKLGSRELCRKGVRVRLPDQSFQILAMLLERRGDLVTREQIRQRLWPGDTFVDFDHGLNNAVNRLREALGDSADSPHFIETLPRRGYRFIAPAQVGSADGSSAQLSSPRPTDLIQTPRVQTGSDSTVDITSTRTSSSARRFLIAAIVVLLLLAVGAVVYWARARAASPRVQSLAVLPLENVSGDASQEYFADGMTDSLITNLAGLRSVRVISRTSAMHYKGSRKTLPEIARELNVDSVLEGTIMRVGDRVRINAQLIDARTDRHLWASAYDRNLRDVLALQSDLASAIANQVASRVDRQSKPNVAKTLNPEAHDAYLRGRQEWIHGAFTDQGYEKSREYFNRALQLDPDYGDAIVGLAEIYIPQDPAAARALCLRALELNTNLGAAHTILGLVKVGNDWDFTGAEAEFKHAVELEPNSVTAHSWYGVFLAEIGRSNEGIRELKIAESLDPLALDVQADIGLALYLGRRYNDAEQVLQHILRQDPQMAVAHGHLLRIYAAREQIPEYIAEISKANAWFERKPKEINALAQQLRGAYASGGAQAFWRAYLEREQQTSTMPPLGLARIYAHLGDQDRCIEILDKEYRQRDFMLVVWIKTDPEFDRVRSDPRFQALLTRIGYPQ